MKKFKILNFVLIFVFLFFNVLLSQTIVTNTFFLSGNTQTFVTPSCISDITITAAGGGGGSAGWGLAPAAIATVIMTPSIGQLLYINVGGAASGSVGGWNGGGNGGVGSSSVGAGGGGATDIRLGGNTLSNRILVMGGGGGSGSCPQQSGSGGTALAYPFNCISLMGNGGGAGTGAGVLGNGGCSGGNTNTYGSGGAGAGLNSPGGVSGGGPGGFGQAGSLGQGGNGGGATNVYGGTNGGVHGAGGGGGGYYGGAGGMSGATSTLSTHFLSGGGGGGSSYIDTTLLFSPAASGASFSDGYVIIRYAVNSIFVSVSGPTLACSGSSVVLLASGASNYTWIPVGIFTGSSTPSVTVNPNVSTTYSVIGSNSLGCTSSAVMSVSVPLTLTLNVSNSASVTGGVCPNRTLNLSASGATTYTWSGGITNAVSFTPTATQTYTVYGSTGCNTGSAAVTVSLHPIPAAVAGISQPTICSGQPVVLEAYGAHTYTWNNSLPNNTSIFPATSTSFTLVATSALGCTNSAVASVSVVTTPINSPVASPSVICVGQTSTITAVGATNYTWSPGLLNTSSIVVTPSATTAYSVTRSNANCITTYSVAVVVNPVPQLSVSISSATVCVGHPGTITASGATNYSWTSSLGGSFGGSINATTHSASATYTLIGFIGNCSATTNINVTALPSPTLSIAATASAICSGETISLTASGANSYTWNTLPLHQIGDSISVLPATTTTYTVTGINSIGCTAQAQKIVVVNSNPNLTANANKSAICIGDSTFLVGSGATLYQWSSNTNNAQTPTVIIKPTVSTIYTVVGSYTNGCNATATVQVRIFSPTFSIIGDSVICSGDQAVLIGSGANSYSIGNASNSPTFVLTPSVTSVYTISATTSSMGINCISHQLFQVSVKPTLKLLIQADLTEFCAGDSINLSASGASSYTWSNLQTGSLITVAPNAGLITYTVNGMNPNSCIAQQTVQLMVSKCTGLSHFLKFVPEIIIFPNPSNESVSFKSNSRLTIRITSSSGKLILNEELDSDRVMIFNAKELVQGIYIVEGFTGENVVRKKLVILE